MTPDVAVMRTAWADCEVALPAYATGGAAGADIRANFPPEQRAEGAQLKPMERMIVPTGLRMAVPAGYELQLRPRSGLAFKQGLTLVNTPGTIDSDYRGDVGVLMINLGAEPVLIRHGDRIAQAVIAPVRQAQFALVETLDDSARGAGGFGSTGVR